VGFPHVRVGHRQALIPKRPLGYSFGAFFFAHSSLWSLSLTRIRYSMRYGQSPTKFADISYFYVFFTSL